MTCPICTLIKHQCRRCAAYERSLAKGLGSTPVVTPTDGARGVRGAGVKSHMVHRVLDHDLAQWVAEGWSFNGWDESSPSLAAQGTRAALIEWAHDGEPVVP